MTSLFNDSLFGDSLDSKLIYNKDSYKEAGCPVNLVIPDGVTEIDSQAFQGCESLQSVTIPESVTEIG